MSSSTYSLPFTTPSKLSLKNETKNGTKMVRIPPLAQQQNNASNTVLSSMQVNESRKCIGRRELVAFGAQLGILAAGLMPTEVAEAVEGVCEFTVSPSGLAFCDQVLGFGAAATQGQLIKAHYVGKLENGKVFDSSYSRGKPLTFRVGVGEVIKGWDQGILGIDGVPPMVTGGKRKLRIPPELGYGMRGAGCKGGTCIIPPNSVLFFDVEFVGKA